MVIFRGFESVVLSTCEAFLNLHFIKYCIMCYLYQVRQLIWG